MFANCAASYLRVWFAWPMNGVNDAHLQCLQLVRSVDAKIGSTTKIFADQWAISSFHRTFQPSQLSYDFFFAMLTETARARAR